MFDIIDFKVKCPRCEVESNSFGDQWFACNCGLAFELSVYNTKKETKNGSKVISLGEKLK